MDAFFHEKLQGRDFSDVLSNSFKLDRKGRSSANDHLFHPFIINDDERLCASETYSNSCHGNILHQKNVRRIYTTNEIRVLGKRFFDLLPSIIASRFGILKNQAI